MAARDERELRAKYFDWCSARLADRFLALSPDEIFEVAERASHSRDSVKNVVVAAGTGVANGFASGEVGPRFYARNRWQPETFRGLVARVAEVLADTLPAFEDWAVAYQLSPEQFDDELLGFWKDNV